MNGEAQLAKNWESDKDESQYLSELTIDSPSTYCIRVVGYLDKKWSDRLGGLKINPISQEGKKAVTTLSGQLIDQAALFGVHNALYDLHLPLLSVDCLEMRRHQED
jgi:hypothetical protein